MVVLFDKFLTSVSPSIMLAAGCSTGRLGGVKLASKLRLMPKRILLFLAWASICLRLIIPMGTMPAGGEWYLILCPNGMTVKQMTSNSGDHHQHHNEDEVELINCDFALLSANDDTTLVAAQDYIAPVQSPTILKPHKLARLSANRLNHFHPRAPPRIRFFYS